MIRPPGDDQGRPRGDQHPVGDAVQLAQARLRHTCQSGCLGQTQGAGRHPGREGGQGPCLQGQLPEESVGVVVRQQNLGSSCGQQHGFVELRIQRQKAFHGKTRQSSHNLSVDVPFYRHRQKEGMVL